MKKTFLFIAIALAFVACNKIEGPYLTQSHQEDVDVTFPDIDPNAVYRKILFDEYTGHRCTNCPDGHNILKGLLNEYGDTLIAVCIHAGDFANLNEANIGLSYDFTTETGDQLYSDFGQPFNPGAIINRNGTTLPKQYWASALQMADRSRHAAIQIINQFNESDQTLKINTRTTFLEDYDQTVLLSLLLVEDSVIKPQKFDDHVDANYVHNHVLRAGINGHYGKYISQNGMVSKDAEYLYGYSLDFKGHDWAAEHCSVIAILLDENSKEVLQVEKARVK